MDSCGLDFGYNFSDILIGVYIGPEGSTDLTAYHDRVGKISSVLQAALSDDLYSDSAAL